jgi:hypothetical protein
MTIAVKMLNDEIKKISETNTLLDLLMEFEKVLEDLEIYAYQNWIKGEVLEGPVLSRHYITVKLMYPYKEMPDPQGAKRLLKLNCPVRYHEDTLITPVRVRSYDDVVVDIRPDGSSVQRAKTKSEPVWVVEVSMPRKYVDEFVSDVVETEEDGYVDPESLNSEDRVAAEQQFTGGDDDFEDLI